MKEILMYVGLNDKDSKVQEVTTEKAKSIISYFNSLSRWAMRIQNKSVNSVILFFQNKQYSIVIPITINYNQLHDKKLEEKTNCQKHKKAYSTNDNHKHLRGNVCRIQNLQFIHSLHSTTTYCVMNLTTLRYRNVLIQQLSREILELTNAYQQLIEMNQVSLTVLSQGVKINV